jgi:ABC-type antimicrobial peptide transport system permease subunit
MLIDAPESGTGEFQKILEQSLVDYGIQMESTSHRLAAFYSVTNTYLSVFMLLGGLGVILGTIGMGIVLSRNLMDRRSEIALLQAIGFNKKTLFRLIFIENLWLLFVGMFIGILSAIVGILPTILSSSFSFHNGTALLLIGIIFLSGLCWIYFPLKSGLNERSIDRLRTE